MTGSGPDALVTLPNGLQIHPAQLQALMQGPLPPNMPPQQAAMLMQARAQLQAMAQAQVQQHQSQQQQQEGGGEATAGEVAKDEVPAAAAKTATVEDGEDA